MPPAAILVAKNVKMNNVLDYVGVFSRFIIKS